MTNILGDPVRRREDARFLRGDAKFTADTMLPGMLHAAILRSPHGHARIKQIDTAAAAKMPGVVRVITAADIAGKMMPLPCVWAPGGVESHFPPHPMGLPGAGMPLASDRVRYVGDPIAVVVAETRGQAFDALEAVLVDYELLPAVVDAELALKPGAPQVHDEVPGNLNARWVAGDEERTNRTIEAAEVVVRERFVNQRMASNPLEPRAAIGLYDAFNDEYTLWASSQMPFAHRLLVSVFILGIAYNKLRVISPDIGGSFGTKGYVYPDMPLVLFLAKETGRPVKWVDTRGGLMCSTVHGRDQVHYGTLAGTKDGKITALRCTSYVNLGAYPSTIGPGAAITMMGRSINGQYAIDAAFCEAFGAFTNIAPLGACRGSGRSEATMLVERLVDLYAAEIGMDRMEVRRKNFVRPEQFPYNTALGWTYDSGNYAPALDRALAMIGYEDVAAKRAEARKRGKRLGVGVSCFVAISGVGPSALINREGLISGCWESTVMRVSASGEVSIAIGSKSHGQGHETTFAQVAAAELGVPVESIEVLHSDTRNAAYGQGSYGSRSFSVCGAAVQVCAQKIKDKVRQLAAHIFGVALENVVYEDARVFVRNSPSQSKTLQEIALALWYAWDLPDGMEPNLEVTTFFDPPNFNFPFGAHAVVIEIDEQTGEIDIVHYAAVDDAGTLGNRMVADGQIHGGIAHGLGQALMEHVVYEPDGQLRTADLADYRMPRARDLPMFDSDWTFTPTPNTALGAKGLGELGAIGSTTAIANAVCDALADLGVRNIDMPITAEKVWRIFQEARASGSTPA